MACPAKYRTLSSACDAHDLTLPLLSASLAASHQSGVSLSLSGKLHFFTEYGPRNSAVKDVVAPATNRGAKCRDQIVTPIGWVGFA